MRNVRRLREEISQSNAGLVHAQYGSMTAGIARWAKGRLPLLISFCGMIFWERLARLRLAHTRKVRPLGQSLGSTWGSGSYREER